MRENEKLFCLQAGAFAAAAVGGTLFHFLYGWTQNSVLTAPFCAVNESTWEHMKLLFFPLFVYALLERRALENRADFWCVKCVGITVSLVLVPVLYYTTLGSFGSSPAYLNIAFFFLSAAACCILEYRLFLRENTLSCAEKLALTSLVLLAGIFVLFTFVTPRIPLFQDPLTLRYGR